MDESPDDYQLDYEALAALEQERAQTTLLDPRLIELDPTFENMHVLYLSYKAGNDSTGQLGGLIVDYLDFLDTLDDNQTPFKDKLIGVFERGLVIIPDDRSHKPSLLNALGDLLEVRFARTGHLADIEKAITYGLQAVSLASDDHEDKPFWLNSLGNYFQQKFERLGNLTDINQAIQLKHEGIDLVSQTCDDYLRLGLVSDLGIAYQTRFERVGQIADIDAAIRYKTDAALPLPEEHADRPSRLNNLGTSYLTRFFRLRELSDLDSSIEYLRLAVIQSESDDSERHMRLNNLGLAYHERFVALGNVEDIHMAIDYQSQSLALIPEGRNERMAVLNNLGSSHQIRAWAINDLCDIDKAIELKALAVSVCPECHLIRPQCLNDLGVSYTDRYEWLHELVDVEQAIEFKTQAVRLTPEEDADFPKRLHSLGVSHLTYGRQFDSLTHINAAAESFEKASKSKSGDPLTKLSAALQWSELASHYEALSILPAYTQVMSLVPQFIWLGGTIERRYKDIALLGGLSSKAAAATIEHQAYGLALEWLEAGRSIVWNQMLQLRSPIDDLQSAHPELADKLRHSANSLDDSSIQSHGLDLTHSLELSAQHRRRSAGEWSALLEEARQLPGFENFLQPKKAADLLRAAELVDAVVVVNVDESRCDALALKKSGDLMPIQLSSFSYQTALKLKESLESSLKSGGARARDQRRPVFQPGQDNNQLKDILATLWDEVVAPILDAMGYLVDLAELEPPHLVWCATGPLTSLPLHAAGRYDRVGANITEFVIPSYAPTLVSLLQPSLPSGRFQGILAVGQEVTAGQKPLPGTVVELDEIQSLASKVSFTRLDGAQATPFNVMSALKNHSWVHLACHASQNPTDATKSAFLLYGGQLDLATITQKSTSRGRLAFLSACQTAMGDENLPEESVHLAAGMSMTGYSTVIATMWSIEDEDAPVVAKHFYEEILSKDAQEDLNTSKALHNAVMILRNKVGTTDFSRWVPYIHVGM